MNIQKRSLVASWLICVSAIGCSDAERPAVELANTQQVSEFGNLERASSARWNVSLDATTQFVRHLYNGRSQSVLSPSKSVEQATHEFLAQYTNLFGVRNPAREMTLSRQEADDLGNVHARFQQVVNGVPVEGGELSTHFNRNGSLVYVYNLFVPSANAVGTTPTLVASSAYEIAFAEHAARNPGFSDKLLWRESETKLVIYPNSQGESFLAYHTNLYVSHSEKVRSANMNYIVDAHTGAILASFDTLHHWDDQVRAPGSLTLQADIATGVGGNFRPADVLASGEGQAKIKREFHADQNGSSFTLTDKTRASGGITTSNASGVIKSSQKDSGWEAAGVDAHYNGGVTYDYYKTVLNRDSIDGNGMAMRSLLDKNIKDNATWDGTKMNYGYGSSASGPFTVGECLSRSLDVAAHEMTHGVTGATSKLCYEGECGGLNESLSDVFGKLVEHSVAPDATKNFIIGWEVTPTGKGIRSMSNPRSFNKNIDHTKDMTSTLDVHFSSGIPNIVFYLSTVGGTHPTSNIKVAAGLGWDKASKVWYQLQTKYLKARSTFADAQKGMMQSATDLNFTTNEQNIIECAWLAVGVPKTGTCKPIDDTGTGGTGSGGGGVGGGSTGGTGTTGGVGGKTGSGGVGGGATGGKAGASGGGGKVGTGGTTAGTGGTTGGKAGTGGTTGGTGGTTGGTGGSTGGQANGGKAGSSSTGGKGNAGTGGTPPSDETADCGCRVAGDGESTSGVGAIAAFAGLAAAVLRRRRRK